VQTNATTIHQYAHALYAAHGDAAEAEAAQKARVAKENGMTAESEKWTSIRLHIREVRGARQS